MDKLNEFLTFSKEIVKNMNEKFHEVKEEVGKNEAFLEKCLELKEVLNEAMKENLKNSLTIEVKEEDEEDNYEKKYLKKYNEMPKSMDKLLTDLPNVFVSGRLAEYKPLVNPILNPNNVTQQPESKFTTVITFGINSSFVTNTSILSGFSMQISLAPGEGEGSTMVELNAIRENPNKFIVLFSSIIGDQVTFNQTIDYSDNETWDSIKDALKYMLSSVIATDTIPRNIGIEMYRIMEEKKPKIQKAQAGMGRSTF